MCCCATPVINGEPGYKWQPNDTPRVRPVYPPALEEHEVLVYDEPGRCGGLDAHSHHYRLVKRLSSYYLLVQHGGGRESIPLSMTQSLATLLVQADTHSRYWLFHTLRYAHSKAKEDAIQERNAFWKHAIASKRVRTRKQRGGSHIKVWIESESNHV